MVPITLPLSLTHMWLCAVLSASAASFIVFRTAVFVFALSSASLCISIVDRVPSICCNCFSYFFFRLRAAMATVEGGTSDQIKVTTTMKQVKFDDSSVGHPKPQQSLVLPRLFFVPFFRAMSSSPSILVSRNSCFFTSIFSVSRSFWMASPVVGATSFLPPNIFPKKLMAVHYARISLDCNKGDAQVEKYPFLLRLL